MPIIHLYVDGAKTACGLPIEGGDSEGMRIHYEPGYRPYYVREGALLSRDPDRVDCSPCIVAMLPQGDPVAGYCDGGCPDCNDQPPAYLHGYSDGKSKAHFEVRYRTADHDPRACGCEPCITVRVVLARETGDAEHLDYPGYKVCRGCGGPDDGHFPDCVVQLYEKRREATPEEKLFQHPRRCDWCGNPANFSIVNLKTYHGRHHFCDRSRCLTYRYLVGWAETRN